MFPTIKTEKTLSALNIKKWTDKLFHFHTQCKFHKSRIHHILNSRDYSN